MSDKPAKKAAAKAEPKKRTVYHPSFAHVSQEIDAADVDSWTDQGWRLTPPTN